MYGKQMRKMRSGMRSAVAGAASGSPNGTGGGAPATELIFGDWYPAVRTDTIARTGQTGTTLLLGVPLLVGRKNDGSLFAMKDLCPHRGIPLSVADADRYAAAAEDLCHQLSLRGA
jgi:Rieske [2Fe-2S] domain